MILARRTTYGAARADPPRHSGQPPNIGSPNTFRLGAVSSSPETDAAPRHDEPKRPAPSPELPGAPHVRAITLACGLTVWVQRHPWPPGHAALVPGSRLTTHHSLGTRASVRSASRARLDEATTAILDTVADLAAHGPRPAELDAVRTFLVRAARRAAGEPRQISRLLAEISYRGVDIAHLGRLDEDYLALDTSAVRESLRITCAAERMLAVRARPRR